jgi:acyl dehydratase
MSARQQSFEAIQIGDSAFIEQSISEEMVARFADLSGDHSPIHMSKETATARGFQDRVVHGFLSGSLVSRVLGMLLPGEYGLLHDVSLQFKKPVYINDRLKVMVTVSEKNDTFRLLTLTVTITNQNEQIVCKGKVTSGMSQ